MALATTVNVEVRKTGDDLNGGGFNTASTGIDYSQQDNPVLSLADVVTSTGRTVTSATGGFTQAMVGNVIGIASVPYEIIAVTNSNTITVDRNTSAATGQIARVGGALATVGKAVSLQSNGANFIWVQYGIYTTTTTTLNASGGPINPSGGYWQGYFQTRGDRLAYPIFKPHTGTMTLFATGSSGNPVFASLRVDANNQSAITAFNIISRSNAVDCEAFGCNVGFSGPCEYCYSDNCATGFGGGACVYCVAKNASAVGYNNSNGTNVIAIGCSIGFSFGSGSTSVYSHATAHNCGTGYSVSSSAFRLNNVVASASTTVGFLGVNGSPALRNAVGVACFGPAGTALTPDIILTSDPFANSGATINGLADAFAAFAPNNVAGGGALLRAASRYGFANIGAVQHKDAATTGKARGRLSIRGL